MRIRPRNRASVNLPPREVPQRLVVLVKGVLAPLLRASGSNVRIDPLFGGHAAHPRYEVGRQRVLVRLRVFEMLPQPDQLGPINRATHFPSPSAPSPDGRSKLGRRTWRASRPGRRRAFPRARYPPPPPQEP